MVIYNTIGDNYPQEWDKTSSEQYVYHNHNVTEIEATEDTPKQYFYEVEQYTNKEYIALMDNMVKDNTDAICELAEIIGG